LCQRLQGRWFPSGLGHDPEKWEPVFGNNHAQEIKVTGLIQQKLDWTLGSGLN
jgi:hypothetical protein